MAGPARARRALPLAFALAAVTAACVGSPHPSPAGVSGSRPQPSLAGPVTPSMTFTGGALPNVYLIVLDDHGGARSMRDLLGYDLQPFLRALRQRGFFVPEHPAANYPRTELSLASMLNLDYVQRLVPSTVDPSSVAPLQRLVERATVPALFRARGYRYVHVGSWWGPTRRGHRAENVIAPAAVSELAHAVGVPMPQPLPGVPAGTFLWERREYLRVLFQFQRLARLADAPAPTFVFGHILAPHRPYVFDRKGRFVSPPASRGRDWGRAYVEEVRFIDRKFLELVDALRSGPPGRRPVILLQSDEGFFEASPGGGSGVSDRHLEQHFDTLAAYSMPNVSSTRLYPTITPVNLFRLLFDDYFGAGLPLLPDRSYLFPDVRHRYAFLDVTDRVRALS